MTKSLYSRLPLIAKPGRARIVLVAVAMLACADAHAQGTDAQREACAPDALKLCQDTIPDIPKTTACMKAHFAELSPRCQTAFNAVTGPSRKARPDRSVAKREAVEPAPAAAATPDASLGTASEGLPGMRAYEADIRKSCREGLIDPFTCRNTLDALKSAE